MKRIISIILTLAMCLSAVALLASCAAGESAYDIAVKHGFKGTEEEWYASLKGDKGETGAKGDKGQTGDKGDKGPTGDAGQKGETGDKGDKGEAGANGANGANGAEGAMGQTGREIEFNVTDTELQWRYVGETEWKTLATLESLKGDKGETGDKGEDGKDGNSPTIGEDGCWWIGDVNTGVVAGTPNEDGTLEVVTCTELWIEGTECAIWVYGGAPSLKIGYTLSNGRTGTAIISESMLINAPTFSGAGVYRDIQFKFLGMTSDKINLTITNTYELVSTVVAVGDDLALEIKRTNADGSTTNIAVTKDMIVSGAVDTTKAGVYPITVMAPEGIKATVNITVVPSFENVLDKTEGLDHNEFTEEKYEITGVITEITGTTNGNMYITDGTNVLYIYKVFDAEGETKYGDFEKKPGVGDTITLYGVVGMYNDAPQMKNAWMKSFEAHEHKYSKPTCDKLSVCSICGATEGEILGHNFVDGICDVCGTSENITIADAIALGNTYASGEYTKDKYYMTGVIKSFYNNGTYYGNFYVTDGINTIVLYGTLSADGTIKYGDMEIKPVVGDTITVYGVIGNFNGTAQMKDGCLIEFVSHECDWEDATCLLPKTCAICGATEGEPAGHIDEDNNAVCDVCDMMTRPLTAGEALGYDDGTTVVVKGRISSIKDAYSSQYNNVSFYIIDDEGNILQCFRVKGGSELKAGDIVIVTGVMTTYQNTGEREIDQGGTYELVEAHVCSTFTDATCTAAAKCTVCGVENGTALEHNFVGGVCSMCGASQSAGPVAEFEFGANGSATHAEGSDMGSSNSFTNNGYTLAITGASKVYSGARDAKGNSCLKMGTSSLVGEFTFTVPSNVTSVIIKIAKYKSNATTVSINGTTYNLTKNSNDGQYDEITVDTTTTKTITIATTSSGKRAMLNTIVFIGEGGEMHTCTTFTEATCTEPAKCTECGEPDGDALGHNYVSNVCSRCGDTKAAVSGELATFEFGTNSAGGEHKDNNSASATLTFTEGEYSINFTGGVKFYDKCYDVNGNACVKLGSSGDAGSVSFTVPDEVTKVIIRAAKYKAKSSKLTVNGTTYTLEKSCDDGEYEEIVVDTTTTKTINLSTVSGATRVMINSITYVAE